MFDAYVHGLQTIKGEVLKQVCKEVEDYYVNDIEQGEKDSIGTR